MCEEELVRPTAGPLQAGELMLLLLPVESLFLLRFQLVDPFPSVRLLQGLGPLQGGLEGADLTCLV